MGTVYAALLLRRLPSSSASARFLPPMVRPHPNPTPRFFSSSSSSPITYAGATVCSTTEIPSDVASLPPVAPSLASLQVLHKLPAAKITEYLDRIAFLHPEMVDQFRVAITKYRSRRAIEDAEIRNNNPAMARSVAHVEGIIQRPFKNLVHIQDALGKPSSSSFKYLESIGGAALALFSFLRHGKKSDVFSSNEGLARDAVRHNLYAITHREDSDEARCAVLHFSTQVKLGDPNATPPKFLADLVGAVLGAAVMDCFNSFSKLERVCSLLVDLKKKLINKSTLRANFDMALRNSMLGGVYTYKLEEEGVTRYYLRTLHLGEVIGTGSTKDDALISAMNNLRKKHVSIAKADHRDDDGNVPDPADQSDNTGNVTGPVVK